MKENRGYEGEESRAKAVVNARTHIGGRASHLIPQGEEEEKEGELTTCVCL